MLCNILEALHSMTPPIIHRDIKPSNIIITSYNYAMLLDFNAAKQFSGQNESDTVLIGTPGYAAPEQYGFGSSSPKTDIYSLGIVLREMLDRITPVPDCRKMYSDDTSRKIPVCGRVKKCRISVILSCAAQHFCCR